MIKELKEESNYSVTENGALGFRTSGRAIVDFNYSISTLRNLEDEFILNKFKRIYDENPEIALKYMFYIGDIREGLGERKIFNVLINEYLPKYPHLIGHIPEYSRWDYLIKMLNNENLSDTIRTIILEIIDTQLKEDYLNMDINQPVSLLAKWLPTANGSNNENRKLAGYLYNHLDTFKQISNKSSKRKKLYRIAVKTLREYINVTESLMCSNRWDEIDFSKVPSRANIIYGDAFNKHCPEERAEFFELLKSNKTKINSSVNTPYDIVSKYRKTAHHLREGEVNDTLENLWKALPEISVDSILPVVDTSASMTWGSLSLTPIDVAIGLGIYLSEKLKGEYKDNYLTFGSVPNMVDFSKCSTLKDKLILANKYSDCSNTNLEAVFDLILKVAKDNNISQEGLPNRILVLTDGEFDQMQQRSHFLNKRLFEEIEYRYKQYGYKLPKLVFWNINGRTSTIPIKENENGVCLVSGMSTNIFKMVMSDKLDPYEIILEQLMSKRYESICL